MKLTGDIFTVDDMLEISKLKLLEDIFDACPISAKVKKIDEHDPLRRKATCFRGNLVELFKHRHRESYFCPLSTSGGRYAFTTQCDLNRKGKRIPLSGIDEGFSDITLSLRRKVLTPYEIDEFQKLFIDIALSTNAFYGRSAESSMYIQRNNFLDANVSNIFNSRLFPDFNRELPDIYWLNYFGPGYLAHWGKHKMIQLQKEYEVTYLKNGGVCIKTTSDIVFADERVKKITDYPFKKAMIDILGYHTFMFENQRPGKSGQYVPTLEEQRKLLDEN